jgi:hypothetical protein
VNLAGDHVSVLRVPLQADHFRLARDPGVSTAGAICEACSSSTDRALSRRGYGTCQAWRFTRSETTPRNGSFFLHIGSRLAMKTEELNLSGTDLIYIELGKYVPQRIEEKRFWTQ